MNHRFLSIVGLVAAMAFTGGCSVNNQTGATAVVEPVAGKPALEVAELPVWAPKNHAFNPARTRVHDLLHTKLRVSFDWEKQHLHGIAELTLKPYFYPQNRLVLDAKGFDIHSVNLVVDNSDSKELQYTYDGMKLTIDLGRSYTRNSKYTIEIDYTAKPNELAVGGSDAITQDKGLYFINPKGEEPNKPRQIWTQGETEANSAWFPTIDSPNERMTQELYITVDQKYTTLSNGTFIYSRKNTNGTKTDYWKMELPHAPYLTMMAIGEYAVVKDKWRDLEVNYYVEPAYEKTAKKIFGNTPEMLEFFSKKLGVDYPWSKYSQVVVRDFVSGAMENTSASTFMEDLQLNERELLDKHWDGIIAHELFHQWFGNYVTTESWANLPLNEAFANYSEYLWTEHKYGAEEAAYHHLEELGQYLDESETKREPLIRYRYADREDMFDSHSYAKGGRVLHMLRKYVGDEAFFASLNRYLTQNKFSDVEVAELRMAFEDTTGEDLMWFFDQWFLRAGHPELKVSHTYQNGALKLQVWQQQDTLYQPIYRLPLKVGVWENGQKKEHAIEITKAHHVFTLPVSTEPQLVLFDSEQQLLGTVEHTKTTEELVFQFEKAKALAPRLEALEELEQELSQQEMVTLLQGALKADFWAVRNLALDVAGRLPGKHAEALEPVVKQIAENDDKGEVRAGAIMLLSEWGDDEYSALYKTAMQDKSYKVAAAGILGYAMTEAPDINQRLAAFEKETNEEIVLALASYYAVKGGAGKIDWFMKQMKSAKGGGLYYLLQSYGAFMAVNPEAYTPEAISMLADLAQEHQLYYVRMAAFQTLMVNSERPEIVELLKEIRANEQDKRLLELYNQVSL
ncbi:M1 family peptidase [Pontibacter sp. HSC-14F20]|uniref:M1 family metallopeptidase n=1 Tax=Pontibacter sp. HSC-14F20 TaxID=2864136 RepID=UPI001C733E8B|nr:M1 family metallopeptidase [Pontibacter sp. HSC-14F20]MBX0333543.1 M1 family peptidase [Pontibacter sp. HSC-14F20]